MRKCAIPSAFIDSQKPDDSREQYNRRFDKKITLFLHPRLIKVEHYGICALIGIGNIRHEIRVNGVTTVAALRIIEIYHIEFRFHIAIFVKVIQQVVESDGTEVGTLEIIDIKRVPFLNHLLDEIVDNGV